MRTALRSCRAGGCRSTMRNRGSRQRSTVNRALRRAEHSSSIARPSRVTAAHATISRASPRVACGLPERRCDLVLVRDQGREAVGTLLAEVPLAGAYECQANAAARCLANTIICRSATSVASDLS